VKGPAHCAASIAVLGIYYDPRPELNPFHDKVELVLVAMAPSLSLTNNASESPYHLNSSENPKDFSHFASLPIEIRLEIWRYVCFTPRNVDVWAVYLGGPLQGPFQNWWPFHFLSNNGIPHILHACRESRLVGLRHYKRCFGTQHSINGFDLTTPPRIYVNPIVDRMCEMDGTMYRRMSPVVEFYKACKRIGIKKVALKVSEDASEFEIGEVKGMVCQLPGLEELVIFDSRQNLDRSGLIDFMDVNAQFEDVDEERELLFRRVDTIMRRTDDGFEMPLRYPLGGNLILGSIPRLRFAHIYLGGARR
jgi:hypothetical protein